MGLALGWLRVGPIDLLTILYQASGRVGAWNLELSVGGAIGEQTIDGNLRQVSGVHWGLRLQRLRSWALRNSTVSLGGFLGAELALLNVDRDALALHFL